ncbi:hypothetical protein [Rhodovibrio salinarum]|uniref:Uncharacterized protein n=1 Tax=Rhodovibrio salinarum TaxID=1087 RepID=A0A934QJN3_9PROT|nr:hypothetical protein [Rhodovibrio salinarum]MBK1698106.1 hypothetical protein [Rhodovibrio salinarum]
MPLWRFIPVADPRDSRWQDRQIRDGLVVRAPSSTMARVIADREVPSAVHGSVGNETRSFRGGFADANLYWVQRVSPDESKQLGGDAGVDGVVQEGSTRETALSVYYGEAGARRR